VGGVYSLRGLILNIIADKVAWCKQFGISINEEDWSCDKLPATLVTDMGSEYKSENFEQIAELGVKVINLPSYRPELKGMIDNLRTTTNIEVDYLQVFRLSNQNGEQKIIHRQEQPAHCNEILVAFIWNPVENAKIFVMDNGTYSTMMLAEEY
jgi:hypothetical protein